MQIILTCPRGLENILSQEILDITNKKSEIDKGFVRVDDVAWDDIYKLNLCSRVASRVLIAISKTRIHKEDDIYAATKSISWDKYFSYEQTFKINIEGVRVRFKSLNFCALRAKDGICDSFREKYGQRPSVNKEKPDVRVHIFLDNQYLFIYLDTSGESLFKRGYKIATGDAPLRENLAAGILLSAGYDGTQSFFDPMCGSGTLAIEAALIAQNRPAGLLRNFAFERFNNFQASVWNKIREQAIKQQRRVQAPIFAADKDSKMINIAKMNAKKAQVEDIIQYSQQEFSCQTAPTDTGILICNPPYGKRLEDLSSIRLSYPAWGTCLKKQFSNWTVGFISADKELPQRVRLLPKTKKPLYNGRLDCRLYLFDIVVGSNRRLTNAENK